MSKIFPVENNFTAGILSPLAQARVDTKAYANGLKQCENFIILPHGGVVRRGGFAKIAQAKTDAGTARLIPFMFSTSPANSYVLEFDGTAGAEVIRVFNSAGHAIVNNPSTSTNTTITASAVLNDLSLGTSSSYTGVYGYTYKVVVTSGDTDKYSWYKDDVLQNSSINCHTAEAELENGLYIKFNAITGHTTGDYWTITFTPIEIDASSWFNADDVWNIRYAQSADVLYMVDGVHKVHKLTRSGTVAAPSFALTEANLVGNPYSSAAKREVKIYRFTQGVFVAISGLMNSNKTKFSDFFTEREPSSSGATDGVYLEKTGSLSDPVYGIVFGEEICAESNYDNAEDSVDSIVPIGSKIRSDIIYYHIPDGIAYSFEIDSPIYIPEEGVYSFGLNVCNIGALYIDEEIVVSRYEYTNLSAKDVAYEYKHNGLTKNLTVGVHHIKARFTVNSNPSWHPENWGVGVGWRKGTTVVTTGNTGTGVLTVDSTNTDVAGLPQNGQWCGNKVYDVIVKISPSGNRFGWTYRRNSNHPVDETTDWPDDYAPATNDGEDVPDGWMVCPVDTNDPAEEIGEVLPATAKQLNAGGINFCKITISGSYAAGDTFTFKVGYQTIPASYFRNTSIPGDIYAPEHITFHQNRMWLAGFSGLPIVRASKTGDFENFALGSNDNEAIEFTIASSKIDTIRWIKSGRKMTLGTTGCEYVVDASSGIITPSDIMVVPHTFYGSDKVDPVQVENSILFVEKNGVRIRDYGYRYDIDGYAGDDQSIISYEEIKDGIKEMVFQQAGQVGFVKNWTMNIPPVNLVWVVTDQNQLKAFTFEKQHNVIAWHKHTLGTLSTAAQVQSIAVIPGTGGDDELWALVSRPTHRWIERLGKTISHDSEGGAEAASFTATLETLPLLMDDEGQTIRTFKKRWVRVNAVIYAGQNISFAEGSETFATEKQTLDAATTAGQNEVETGSTGWDTESTLVFKSEPTSSDICYPCVITAIHGKVQVNES